MPAKLIEGDLFEAAEQYIVHQCNCVTWSPAHLAKAVFERYPYADIYHERKIKVEADVNYRDEPGSIIIRGNGKDQRYVIAILGQIFPGKPRLNQQTLDSFKQRRKYFFSGLQKISEIEGLTSVAFPARIGCGAAGADWNEYHELIDKFADFLPSVEVKIYKLPE